MSESAAGCRGVRARTQRVLFTVEDNRKDPESEEGEGRDSDADTTGEEDEGESEEEIKPRRVKSPVRRKKAVADDDEEDENEDEAAGGKSTKVKARKAGGGTKRKKAGGKEAGASSTLFQAVKRAAALSAVASDWVSRYRKDADAAVEELLSFLLLSAGGTRAYAPPEGTAVPDMGEEDWTDLLEKFFEDVGDAGPTANTLLGHSGRAKAPKASQKFRDNFCELWRRIAEASKDRAGSYDADLLDAIISLLVTLCSARLAELRLVATLAACELTTALVEGRAQVLAKLETTEQQLRASRARGEDAATKTEALAVQQRWGAKAAAALEEASDAVLNGVWVHRYRDVFEPVRVECVRALGAWMVALPAVFVRDQFLKYMGWLLYDKGAATRLAVVDGLQEVYRQQDLLGRLEPFTQRFRVAMVRMSLDTDGGVAESALKLLRLAYDGGLLEDMPEEEREKVVSAVFEPSLPTPARSEALAFMLDQLAAFDEEEAAAAVKAAEKRGGASAVAAQEQCYATAQVEALLQIVAGQIDESIRGEGDFGDQETEEEATRGGAVAPREKIVKARLGTVELLAEALWPLPAARVLRNWDALCDLLARDVGDKAGGPLEETEQAMLAKLMVVTASRLQQEAAGAGGKTSKDAQGGPKSPGRRRGSTGAGAAAKDARLAAQEALGSMTEVLLRRLPVMLAKFAGDEIKVSLLAVLPQYMWAPTLALGPSRTGLAALLSRLREAYLTSESDEALAAVAESLRILGGGGHGRAGDVEGAMHALLADVADKVVSAPTAQDVADQLEAGDVALAPANAARDEEFSLALAMRRLRHLVGNLDSAGHVEDDKLWPALAAAVEARCDLDSPVYARLQTSAGGDDAEMDVVAMAALADGMVSAGIVASQGLQALLTALMRHVRQQVESIRSRVQRPGRRGKGGGKGGGTKKKGKKEKDQEAEEGEGEKTGDEAESEAGDTEGEEDKDGEGEGAAAAVGQKRKRGKKAGKAGSAKKKPARKGAAAAAAAEDSGDESGGNDIVELDMDEADESLAASVGVTEQLRDSLVSALRAAMSMHLAMVAPSPSSAASGAAETAVPTPRELSAEEAPAVAAVQRAAYLCCSTLRVVLSESSLGNVPYLRHLMWRPDAHLSGLLQLYFDAQEELVVNGELDEAVEGDEYDPARAEQAQQLLLPMMEGIWGSAEALNKRQAAAVVSLFVGVGDQAMELVKGFCSKLKNFNSVRYLEVIMATLRVAYGRLVRAVTENPDLDLDTADEAALEEAVTAGTRRWMALAHRLAQSLGVGQLKGRDLQDSFLRFMKEGVRFSLEAAPKRFGFLESMTLFLSKLSPKQRQELAAYFNEAASTFDDDVVADLETYQRMSEAPEDGGEVPPAWQVLLDFHAALEGGSRAPRSVRKPAAAARKRRQKGKKTAAAPALKGTGDGRRRGGKGGGGRRRGAAGDKESGEEQDGSEEEDDEGGGASGAESPGSPDAATDAEAGASPQGPVSAPSSAIARRGRSVALRLSQEATPGAPAAAAAAAAGASGGARRLSSLTRSERSEAGEEPAADEEEAASEDQPLLPTPSQPPQPSQKAQLSQQRHQQERPAAAAAAASGAGEGDEEDEDDDDLPLLPDEEDEEEKQDDAHRPLAAATAAAASPASSSDGGGSGRRSSGGQASGKASRDSRGSSRRSELFPLAEMPEGGSDGEMEDAREAADAGAAEDKGGKRKRGSDSAGVPGAGDLGQEQPGEDEESDDEGMFEDLTPASSKKPRAVG